MQADADNLFEKCKQSGKPFFEWNDWIANHIEESLKAFATYKKSRLANLFKRGKDKLIKNVGESELRQSTYSHKSKTK